MAKLIERFEKQIKLPNGSIQLQVLELEVDSNDGEDFAYEDVKITLYLNNNPIADISHVIAKTSIYQDLIDGVDWKALSRQARIEDAA
jgi:hypothetical protein